MVFQTWRLCCKRSLVQRCPSDIAINRCLLWSPSTPKPEVISRLFLRVTDPSYFSSHFPLAFPNVKLGSNPGVTVGQLRING